MRMSNKEVTESVKPDPVNEVVMYLDAVEEGHGEV